jgi:hypothetical protein
VTWPVPLGPLPVDLDRGDRIELPERGTFRADYAGDTLRSHLGLDGEDAPRSDDARITTA